MIIIIQETIIIMNVTIVAVSHIIIIVVVIIAINRQIVIDVQDHLVQIVIDADKKERFENSN